MPEKPQKSPKGPTKKKPWPEDLVTSPKTQQIGQAISQIHHHLDQLMEQADLIAAYMPPQPVITSRPVVTLNASMIVTQKQEDEEALRALRQDIAQKQTDLAANTQTTNKQTTNTQNTNIAALHNDDVKQAEMPNSGSDAQKPHATQEAKTIAPETEGDNELQALIRAYVKHCLEEEAPRLIHKELLSVLATELNVPQKRDGKK